MKILKYIFTLILLSAICLSVFIATKKGDYTIKNSKKIEQNSHLIHAYIQDIRSFTQWGNYDFLPTEFLDSKQGKQTILGENNFSVNIENHQSNQFDFKINQNGNITNHKITIKPINKELTLVEMESTGTLSFIERVKSIFVGGATGLKNSRLEKMLNNVNFYVNNSIKNYEIEKQNKEYIADFYYIAKSFTSSTHNISDKIIQAKNELKSWGEKYKIPLKKEYFVEFFKTENPTENPTENLYVYKIMIPTKNEVFSEIVDEKIIFGKKNGFYALKTKLIGDFSHFSTLKSFSINEIDKQSISTDLNNTPVFKIISDYEDSFEKNKWESIIFYPISEIENNSEIELQTDTNSVDNQ